MKYYEFRYRSKEVRIFNSILNFICCFLYPMFIMGFILVILYKFNLTHNWKEGIYSVLMFCSFIVGVIFAIRYCSKAKGVFLFDNHLEIDRYYITTLHWKPNMNINYSDIKRVYNSRQAIDISTFNAMNAVVGGGDLTYYTEIILNCGKVYRVPVQNQELFLDSLVKKINNYREKNGLEKI